MGNINHGPRLLYLFPQRTDCGLIFLRKLERSLHLGRVVDDLPIELAAFSYQAFFLLVRFFQRSMQFFIFKPIRWRNQAEWSLQESVIRWHQGEMEKTQLILSISI